MYSRLLYGVDTVGWDIKCTIVCLCICEIGTCGVIVLCASIVHRC